MFRIYDALARSCVAYERVGYKPSEKPTAVSTIENQEKEHKIESGEQIDVSQEITAFRRHLNIKEVNVA